MPSLKSLVQGILTSFRESHKSVPQNTYTAYEYANCGGISTIANQKFIMPCDGLFVAQAESTLLCVRKGATIDAWNSGVTGSASWPCGAVPAKKGDALHFYVPSDSPTTVFYRVYKYIGAS